MRFRAPPDCGGQASRQGQQSAKTVHVRATPGVNPAPVHHGRRRALTHTPDTTQQPALGIEQAAHVGRRAGRATQSPTTGWRIGLNLTRPTQRQDGWHAVPEPPGRPELMPQPPGKRCTRQQHPRRAPASPYILPDGQQPRPTQKGECKQQERRKQAQHDRRAKSTWLQAPGARSKQGRWRHGSQTRAQQRPHGIRRA